MAFVDELRKQEPKKKPTATVHNIIAAIKSGCIKNKSAGQIDGYYCECSGHDTCEHGEIRALPEKYTNETINRRGVSNQFHPTTAKQVNRYNTNHYGKEQFFFLADEIETEDFNARIEKELKELGFSDYSVALVPVENEVGVLSRGLTGSIKIKYEKTGEWGYLIRIRVSW